MSLTKRTEWFDKHFNVIPVPDEQKEEFTKHVQDLMINKKGVYAIIYIFRRYYVITSPKKRFFFRNFLIGATNHQLYIEPIISYHKYGKVSNRFSFQKLQRAWSGSALGCFIRRRRNAR